MLLAVDVGNTHTVFGMYTGDTLEHQWRLATHLDRTADEMNMEIGGFLFIEGHWLTEIEGVVVSSVVPEMADALERMATGIMGLDPVIVDSETDTGVPVLCDNPEQVGPDRIVDAVGAIDRYGAPCIVIDFGTANTIDAINANGEYLGGAITLGIHGTSAALVKAAARLIKVKLEPPGSAIGRNTVDAIRAGLIYGAAGQVDRLTEHMKEEIGADAKVIATGGLADIHREVCRTIDVVDHDLTLHGLRLIYERNRGRCGEA